MCCLREWGSNLVRVGVDMRMRQASVASPGEGIQSAREFYCFTLFHYIWRFFMLIDSADDMS